MTVRAPLATLILCLTACASAGARAAPSPAGGPTAACPGAATVPMIKYDGVRPGLEVMVNGRGPFLFLLDTGASGELRADSTLVEKLGLPVIGEVLIDDKSSGPQRTAKTIAIETLSFGGISFRHRSGGSRTYNSATAKRKIDGILGFDLFADCLLTFDYPRSLIIVRSGALKPRHPDVVAFDRSNSTPAIAITVGTLRIAADLDTGANHGFNLPEALASKLTATGATVLTGYGNSANQRFPIRETPIAETIRIGKLEWPAPTVEFSDIFDFATIGSKELQDIVITFDQKRGLVRLARPRRPTR